MPRRPHSAAGPAAPLLPASAPGLAVVLLLAASVIAHPAIAQESPRPMTIVDLIEVPRLSEPR
ncbi:MAG TPA: hypothetical protein VLL48_08170, partial [Longimicrobiales bacterium]|nr:hypothetical protein [Longimicrobiales bacterium]